jgi:hypothetical protein
MFTITKYLSFLITTLFFTTQIFAQVKVNVSFTTNSKLNPATIIYYNKLKKLTWSNFIGMPVASSNAAAITSSGFGYMADMQTKNDVGTINIKVYCYFNKQKSWVKPSAKTAYILEHEQRHFDITYINTLAFMESIKKATITPDNMNEVLGKLYKQTNDSMSQMQIQYDAETSNGINKIQQAKWNKLIAFKL